LAWRLTPQREGIEALLAAVDPEGELLGSVRQSPQALIGQDRDWFSEHDISSSGRLWMPLDWQR